jgi:hypothetical protein
VILPNGFRHPHLVHVLANSEVSLEPPQDLEKSQP